MGIYDREYLREEDGGGWRTGMAPVCRGLILANVVVFLAQWLARDLRLADWLAASSYEVLAQGRVWQLLTAAFFHQDLLHILFNMLVLWWFGRDVEEIYGPREFLRMYLTAAVLSTLAWAILDFYGNGDGRGQMLGASGAVMAVFVIYAMYYPRREVLLFFVIPVQIWLLLVLYIAYDSLMLLQQAKQAGPGAGVAFAAHLGGAAYGYLYKRFDLRWSKILGRPNFRPRLKVYRPSKAERSKATGSGGSRKVEAAARPAPAASGASRPSAAVLISEEQFEQQLDNILAKIAREGRGSLTEDENRMLQEASRRAQIRRGESH